MRTFVKKQSLRALQNKRTLPCASSVVTFLKEKKILNHYLQSVISMSSREMSKVAVSAG